MSGGLQPGDRVLDLRAVARSGGIFAGLVVAPVAVGLSGWPWGWCVAAVVAGAVVGLVVGGVAGRLVFRAPPGQAVVARVGPAALGVALRASISGGFVVSLAGAVAAFMGAGGVAAGIALLAGLGASVGAGCMTAMV